MHFGFQQTVEFRVKKADTSPGRGMAAFSSGANSFLSFLAILWSPRLSVSFFHLLEFSSRPPSAAPIANLHGPRTGNQSSGHSVIVLESDTDIRSESGARRHFSNQPTDQPRLTDEEEKKYNFLLWKWTDLWNGMESVIICWEFVEYESIGVLLEFGDILCLRSSIRKQQKLYYIEI